MHSWVDTAGDVSAATLGFIGGDVAGAIGGYKWMHGRHKKLPKQNMAPITPPSSSRRTKRTRTPGNGRGPSKRLFGGWKSKHLIKAAPATRIANAGTAHAVAVSTKKRIRLKKVKKVKVSKRLRQAIKQVETGYLPNGFFQETHYGAFPIDIARVCNSNIGDGIYKSFPGPYTAIDSLDQQAVFGRSNNSKWNFDHFTFNQIMDACSVLFQNKINQLASAYQTTVTPLQNAEDRHAQWPVPYLPTVASGLMESKFRLINSSVTYKLKNNSQRAFKVKIYSCTPKKVRDWDNADTSLGSGLPTGLASRDWYDACNYENQGTDLNVGQTVYPRGVGATIIAGQNNGVGTPTCVNTVGNTPNHMHFAPGTTSFFNQLWKTGCKVIELQPGQEYTHVAQGPKNVDIVPKKWIFNRKPDNVFVNNEAYGSTFAYMKPGFSQSDIFVVQPDLLTFQNGVLSDAASGYIWQGTNYANCIAIECTKTFKVEMPEIVGSIEKVVVPEGGATITANLSLRNRKPAVYTNQWYLTGPLSGTVDRIDAENPVTEIDLD